MNDEVGVRVRNRFKHAKKQADSGTHVQLVRIAVNIDRLPFNIFEDKIRLPGRTDAGIHEFSDVAMEKASQDGALALESFFAAASNQARAEKLDRCFALKAPITALREPDRSHASVSDGRDQAVSPDRLPCESRSFLDRDRGSFQESFFADRLVFFEKFFYLERHSGILVAQRIEPPGAVRFRKGQGLVEIGIQQTPLIRAQRRHRYLTTADRFATPDAGRFLPSPIYAVPFALKDCA